MAAQEVTENDLLLNQQTIVSFSTATIGLPKTRELTKDTLDKWPRIVRLSYIISTNNVPVDIIITNVDMSKSTVPKAMMEENLGRSDDSYNLPIAAAIKLFVDHCQDSPGNNLFVTHNANFHVKVLQAEMMRLDYDLKKIFRPGSVRCTMESNIKFCNIKRKGSNNTTLKFPKLQELYKKLFPEQEFPVTPISVDNAFYVLKCYQQQLLISSLEELS